MIKIKYIDVNEVIAALYTIPDEKFTIDVKAVPALSLFLPQNRNQLNSYPLEVINSAAPPQNLCIICNKLFINRFYDGSNQMDDFYQSIYRFTCDSCCVQFQGMESGVQYRGMEGIRMNPMEPRHELIKVMMNPRPSYVHCEHSYPAKWSSDQNQQQVHCGSDNEK